MNRRWIGSERSDLSPMPESGEFQQSASEKTKEGIIISRSACGSRGSIVKMVHNSKKWVWSKEQRFTSIMDSPQQWAGHRTRSWHGAAGVKSLQPITAACLEWRRAHCESRSGCQTDDMLCSAVVGRKMKHLFALDKSFHRVENYYSGCASRQQELNTMSMCSWKPRSESQTQAWNSAVECRESKGFAPN